LRDCYSQYGSSPGNLVGRTPNVSDSNDPNGNAPQVEPRGVTFRLADADDALIAVDLTQEVLRPRTGPRFSKANGTKEWQLRLPRPPANRIEYRLALTHRNGDVEVICDPSNPATAPGAFGEQSVVEWPEYLAPAWLSAPVSEGLRIELSITSKILRRELPVVLWTAPERSAREPLPLLVVHDGVEYDKFSKLTHYLAWLASEGRIPPLRAALMAPVDRDEIYSASATYSRSLAHELIPALSELAPSPHGRTMRIGMGASLGALAMLHAHRTHPAVFGALFLQSGSFFRRQSDPQEVGFARFTRIARFMGKIASDEQWAHPIPVAMTCGSAEENLHNNRSLRDTLGTQAYDVAWYEHPDAHNWISWRDSFDPPLTQLLRKLWS
jgi:enterochelin esterase-like enzyme